MFSWIKAIDRKMIHTCTGLCKLFVNKLYKGRSGQRAWPVAYPPRKRITTFSCWICVGGSRRTTLCMPRLHTGTWSRYPGCRTKQKQAWSDQKAEQEGVGKERERRREVPQLLRHWRGRRQAALGGQTQLLTAAKHHLFCHRTESWQVLANVTS
jgi:hypothetical protein